jgi:alkylhydroperoxidase family enzyme
MEAYAILALIKLLQDLTPEAAAAIRDLFDKLSGMTPEQIVALTHQINAANTANIDAELAKLPPASGRVPPTSASGD